MNKKNWPSFSESMKYSYDYLNIRIDQKYWDIIETRYQKIKEREAQTTKIPKIIHQIWLGGNMPKAEQKMIEQIKLSLDSSWEHKLWTEDNINDLSHFENLELYHLTPNYGQKSDLLRYNILNEIGGIYMDTDFIIQRNFDELLDLEFFCGVAYDNTPSLFNGLIGSTPHTSITQSLLHMDRELMCDDAMKLMDSTGPYFLTRKLFKHITNNENILVMPNSFFYPYPNFDRCKKYGNDYKQYLTDTTFCCHMWSSSWM